MKERKVAVVTGGADGIGSGIVSRLSSEGMIVAIVDKDEKKAKIKAEEITASGNEAKAFHCDLSRPEEIEAVFDKIIEAFGRIDVLINNAGVGGYLSWQDMSMEEWHRFTSVNCDAAFLCVQRAAKEMIQRKIQGDIILVLSQAALNQDETIVVPYGVSKWGERGLMRSAASALRKYGIAVNGICPGTVWTPMMDGFCQEYLDAGSGTKEEYLAFIESKYPLNRIQTAEDMANMCLFLLRDGHHMSGQTLPVAGGIIFS